MPRYVKAGCLLAVSLASLCGALLYREFELRSPSLVAPAHLPRTAIVFTGQFDRVDMALALFEQGAVERLFISGVNAGAGMRPEDFATQFHLSETAQAGLRGGQITLASDAKTTLENALETACWLAQKGPFPDGIVLITGRAHMPRAALALERALEQPLALVRLSPAEERTLAPRQRFAEFGKFAATALLGLWPKRFWPQTIPSLCAQPSQARGPGVLAENTDRVLGLNGVGRAVACIS